MRNITTLGVVLVGLSLAGRPVEAQDLPQYDLVFSGGHVVDGTGNPWFRADVALLDGRIVRVGTLDPGWDLPGDLITLDQKNPPPIS